MHAVVIAVANQKGGVGKTTTVLNLGTELASIGKRVLIVDVDPQSSLTSTLGIEASEENLAHVLGVIEKGTLNIGDILWQINDNLDVAPGDILLSRTELGLVIRSAREQQLARSLLPVLPNYDFIILDCPPSLGLLTVNALIAATWVIVPTILDVLALRGLSLFINTLAEIRQDYGMGAKLLGVLPTLTDIRTVHARQILEGLRQRDDLLLFQNMVPRSIRFSEAALKRQSIRDYDPQNLGYNRIAEEVLERVNANT
jgi:chromosome partitioning protein